MIMLLFSLGEGEEDLMEGWIEHNAWELLQISVEGVGVEQFKNRSWEEGEDSVKGQAKCIW